jgi:hypothetical protein
MQAGCIRASKLCGLKVLSSTRFIGVRVMVRTVNTAYRALSKFQSSEIGKSSALTVRCDEKNRCAHLFLSMAVVAALLLIQPFYADAQHASPPTGPSENEKAKMQEKRAFEKDADEAYKSTISKIPDAKQKIDPWGSMRTAPQK